MKKLFTLLLSTLLMWSCSTEEFGDSDRSVTPATRSTSSVDFTDPAGTFVVCEGNMTTVNGTVVYYDANGREYTDVFEKANGGLEIGNVVQDMYMANDRIYFITQNGDRMGGAGRLVVCDARTMRKIYADPLVFTTPEGKGAWPQHLVVVSPTKAYVQYSDSGMETTSGIVSLTLTENGVQVEGTVDGTFGKFTSEGATKTRMLYSRGKVYAACGYSVITIDPETDIIENRITYTGQQVKGIVKGADGNIYFALAGAFSGSMYSPLWVSRPKIVCMSHDGVVLSENEMPAGIQLPVASWSPAVGMCASFTDPYLYFVDTNDFNAKTATRYNYADGSFEQHFVSGGETIYGIMGQHPATGELWVGTSSYTDSEICVYDVSGTAAAELRRLSYPTQKGASPAGIDFTYRFTSEYINK